MINLNTTNTGGQTTTTNNTSSLANISGQEGADMIGKTISIISNYQQAKSNIRQLKADAAARIGFGKLEAERIRRDGERVKSKAQSELAASGLEVSGLQGQAIQDTIKFNSEMNAYEKIFTAQNEANALLKQAEILKKQQKGQLVQGVLSLGSGIAKAMSGMPPA